MDPASPAARLARQIGFILEVDKLKEILRQTVTTGTRRPENDAEHSWHLCLCAIVLSEHANIPSLDLARVLKMLVLHDLVEIDAGDAFIYDAHANAAKAERERLAADRIFGLLPSDQAAAFRGLWEEFEARQSPEAKFAAAVDRFQPMLLNRNTEGASWRKHGITRDRVVAKNGHIAEGCAVLWTFAETMLEEAVQLGYLGREPGPRPVS